MVLSVRRPAPLGQPPVPAVFSDRLGADSDHLRRLLSSVILDFTDHSGTLPVTFKLDLTGDGIGCELGQLFAGKLDIGSSHDLDLLGLVLFLMLISTASLTGK